MLSLKSQEMLCTKYVRDNCEYEVPLVVTKIIQSLWSDTLYFLFNGSKLKSMLNTDRTIKVKSKHENIQNRSVSTTIYASPSQPHRPGMIQLYVHCKNDMKYSMNVAIELKCIQTGCYTNVRDTTNNEFRRGITVNVLDVQQYDRLEFLCYVNVLAIKQK
eukprot:457052_1